MTRIALFLLLLACAVLIGCASEETYDKRWSYCKRAECGAVTVYQVNIDGEDYLVCDRPSGGVAICPKAKPEAAK